MDILNVREPFASDESIVSYQEHNVLPKTGAHYGNLKEIHFVIQNPDCYIHPSNSYLYIEGKFETDANGVPARTKFSNNGVAFLFDEARYEINSTEIDRTRNVGIVSSLKNYVSIEKGETNAAIPAGWNPKYEENFVDATTGNFTACLPLKMILGFAEDYRLITFSQQSLILTRARSDNNSYQMRAAVTQANAIENCKVTINTIIWRVPFVKLADKGRLKLMKIIDRRLPIEMHFRSFELLEYPMLPQTTRHTWNVKTTSQLEKPRYIIFGFQTARKNNIEKDASRFDHCNLINLRVYIDQEVFPYNDLNIAFDENRYTRLYEMFCKFQQIYYQRERSCPQLSMTEFKNIAPIVVIDCTRQDESVKKGSVDIRLDFQTKENIDADTAGFCLIIHDRIVEIELFSNRVIRI